MDTNNRGNLDVNYLTGEALLPTEENTVKTFSEAYEVMRSSAFASTENMRAGYPLLGGTIITLTDFPTGEHMARRRPQLALVSPEVRERFEFTEFVPEYEAALQQARGSGENVGNIDLVEITKSPVLNAVTSLVGLDQNKEGLLEVATAITDAATASFTRADPSILEKGFEAKEIFWQQYFEPAKNRRTKLINSWKSGDIAESDLPVDLITIMLRSEEDHDDETIVKECCFYMAASFSSLANAVPSVLYEILKWTDEHEEDYSRFIEDAQLLQAAVQEALRLHPPAPQLMREALKDIHLESTGREVPKGKTLFIDLIRTSRDPAVFGNDAEHFNPRRELQSVAHKAGLSFGLGSHLCLAKPLLVGPVGGSTDQSKPIGMLVRTIRTLLLHGVQIDPDNPPCTKEELVHEEWRTFPLLVSGGRSSG